MREDVLQFLATKGPEFRRDVLTPVIVLLTRIVKLSWFDDESHQQIVQNLLNFLSVSNILILKESVAHCFIGVLALE